MVGDSETFEKVVALEDEVQAQLLGAALTELGIPHILRSYYDSAYDGIFQQAAGWGHVESLPEYREQILGILEDLASGPLPTGMEGEPTA